MSAGDLGVGSGRRDPAGPRARRGGPRASPVGHPGDTLGSVDRTRLTGIALVVVSAIAFGSGGLFARPVYDTGVDWLTLMAWRFGIAGALAWAVLLARPRARRALGAIPRRTLLVSIGLGAWYVTNTASYYAGITTVPLGLAALIVYIYPPVVAVLALRLGRPLEGRRAWSALGVAVLGVALAVGGIDAATAPPTEGLILILASPLFYATWIILAARHSGERKDRTGHEADDGASTSVIGAVMLTSTAAVYWFVNLGIGHPVLPADVPSAAWPGIVAVALIAGFVPVQAFYAGAQRVGAAQASLISTVEPLWTIVAAALLFGEHLQPVQLAGGALILLGVLLSQTRGRARAGAATGAASGAAPKLDEPPLPQPVVRLGEE